MKKTLKGLFIILLIISTSQAQSTLNATGNSAEINGNTYAYFIGEMLLVNNTTANNIEVTQGILQTTKSTVGIANIKLTDNELRIYPSPLKNVLNLEAKLQEKGKLKLQIYDLAGKELLHQDWNVNQENEVLQLNLEAYAAGNYILIVQFKKDNKTAQQSYKIQKIR